MGGNKKNKNDIKLKIMVYNGWRKVGNLHE